MDTAIIKYRFIITEGGYSLEVNEGDMEWNPVYESLINLRELVREMANLTDEGEELTVLQRIEALRVIPHGILELIRKNLYETENRDAQWGAGDPSLSLGTKLKRWQALTRTRNALWLIERALE